MKPRGFYFRLHRSTPRWNPKTLFRGGGGGNGLFLSSKIIYWSSTGVSVIQDRIAAASSKWHGIIYLTVFRSSYMNAVVRRMPIPLAGKKKKKEKKE